MVGAEGLQNFQFSPSRMASTGLFDISFTESFGIEPIKQTVGENVPTLKFFWGGWPTPCPPVVTALWCTFECKNYRSTHSIT